MARALSILPIVALLVACGGSTAAESTSTPAPSEETPGQDTSTGGAEGSPGAAPSNANLCVGVANTPSCESALDVATADEVFAQIAALTESVEASTKKDSGAKLRPTRDLHATATIELDITVFRAAHPACSGADAGTFGPDGSGCEESVFAAEQTKAVGFGGSLQGKPLPEVLPCDASDDRGCTKVTLPAGTTVRFARSTTRYAFGNRFPHYVRVTRACAAPCEDDQLRCEASATCIDAGAFCLLCEGETLPVCACRDACTARAEGASCAYETSDDMAASGTCDAGTCKAKP